MIKGIFKFFRISRKFAKRVLSPEEYARKIGVTIGENCVISTVHFTGEPYLITIGDNVIITARVRFYTHGGSILFRNKYPDLDYFGKIIIGNNCYIGEDAKIMPGVTIEDNCIIGAGSIVTKSIPEGCIVAGNPAVYVGDTSGFLKKIKKLNIKTKKLNYKDKKKKLFSLGEDSFLKKEYLKIKKP